MPQEELTPRSDSVSTEASGGSPPDQSEIGNSPPDHSETSSGVHSNSSRESAQRRSTSVDDLAADAAHKVAYTQILFLGCYFTFLSLN